MNLKFEVTLNQAALTLVLSALASLLLGGSKPADLPPIDNNSPCVPNQVEQQKHLR